MKENDWIVAELNNPGTNPGEFRTLGMNMENTLMLSKEEYLKSDFIKNNDAFKDESGKFVLSKFDDFYDLKLLEFKLFSEIEDGFQYDLFDYRRFLEKHANVKDPKLTMILISNPDEKIIGNGWINQINESPLSDRERAQKSKVFDYSTGQFLEYSPNEHALIKNPIEWFKDIFKEPLVLATYDSDGTHIDPITGIVTKHAKGDKKLDNNGKYYYETLNGRPLSGKTVLSGFDTLTVDGEGLNSIDFLDSDGRDKSIGGTIMKMSASLAPLFIGGPVGIAYSTALVGRELMKSLPMIDGLFSFVVGNEDTPFTKLANTLAGKAQAASMSTSDYSALNQMSFENLANLLGDVALQWGLLKIIALSLQKLAGSNKLLSEAEKTAESVWKAKAPVMINAERAKGTAEELITKSFGTAETWKESDFGKVLLENALAPVHKKLKHINRLGADASLAYMALVSNADTYQSMLEHGTTKKEAAAVALGATLGMFKVDKDLGLGEMFFDELANNNLRSILAVLKNESSLWTATIANGITKSAVKKSPKTIMANAYNSYLKVYDKFWDDIKHHTTGAFAKMVGEGLEEVSEELVTDLSKQAYELAADFAPTNKLFGGLTTNNVGAFDDAFNNPEWFSLMVARYGMNFLGGFLGGGIFYAKERFDGKDFRRDTSEDTLILNVRNFGADAVIKVLEDYRNNGKLGSTTKSFRYEITKDGQRVFLDSNSVLDSQNEFVYNQLLREILGISAIINDNELLMSDELLGYRMTLGEARFQELMSDNGVGGDYSKDLRARYDKLTTDYVATVKNIQALVNKTDKVGERDLEALNKLLQRKTDLEEQLKLFVSGDNAIDYMGKVLFLMDDRISDIFYIPNFKSWLKYRHLNKIDDYIINPMTMDEFDHLSQTEKSALVEQYLQYKNSELLDRDAEIAWSVFKDIRSEISPEFKNMQLKTKLFSHYIEKINNIFKKENNPFDKITRISPEDITEDNEDESLRYNWDDLYEGESFIDYNNRNSLTDEERLQRIAKLKQTKALLANEALQIKALDTILEAVQNSGGLLDESTKRHLLLLVGVRQSDIIKENIEKFGLNTLSSSVQLVIDTHLSELKPDLSNYSSVVSAITEEIINDTTNSLINDIDSKIAPRIDQITSILQRAGIDYSKSDTVIDINSIVELIKQSDLKTATVSAILQNPALNLYDGDVLSEEKFNIFIAELKEKASLTFLPINLSKLSLEELDKVKEKLAEDPYSWDDASLSKIKLNDRNSSIYNDATKHALLSLVLQDLGYNQAFDYHEELSLKELDILLELLTALGLSKTFLRDYLIDKDNKISFSDLQSLVEPILEDSANNIMKARTINGKADIVYYKGLLKKLFGSSSLFSVANIKEMFSPDENGNVRWENIDKVINWYNDINLSDLLGDYDEIDTSLLQDSERYNQIIEHLKTQLENKFSSFFEGVNSNKIYNYIKEINNATPIDNPIINIVKKLGLSLNRDTKNIEELLLKLMTGLEQKGSESFTLSLADRDSLEDAMSLLKMAEAFVYAALESKDIQNPFPHNKLLSSLAKKHGIQMEEFPTIDEDIANLYIQQIHSLIKEIGIEENPQSDNPWTVGSWRWWDAKNAFNKSLQFTLSREKNINAKLSIFSLNADAFKNSEFNLLDGIENIESGLALDVKLYKIEQLFYKNIHALLETKSLEEILESLPLLNEWFSDENECANLTTADLTATLRYLDLTAMDKGLYLITVAGISSEKFHLFLKKFKDAHLNLAALDILQHVSRAGLAYQESPELFRLGLNWLYRKMKKQYNPELLYATFIGGNGGAGKSEVIIRQQAEYALLKYSPELIILSGPTNDQLGRLKELNVGKVVAYLDMIKDMLGDENYTKYENNDATIITQKENNNATFHVLSKDVALKDLGYKLIIIDEATHLSTKALSVFSEYARLFNISLILVGDNYQSGYMLDAFPTNLTQETAFLARTSRLSITLRDGNLQKWNNVQLMTELLKRATIIPDDASRDHAISLFKSALNKLLLSYYLGSELNGDIIVDTLEEDLMKKLALKDIKGKERKILYVGSNDTIVSKLKLLYGDSNVEQKTKILELQGSEYSNIIIDIKIGDIDTSSSNSTLNTLSEWLSNFYTLSTRGINSAIFIDKDHKIRHIIKESTRELYKNSTSNFNEESIRKFSLELDAFYSKINLPESLQTTPETTTPETPESTTSSEETTPEGVRSSKSASVNTVELSEEYEPLVLYKKDNNNETYIDGNYVDVNIQSANTTANNEQRDISDQSESEYYDGYTTDQFDSILVYGENTLSGMPFTETTLTSKDGKNKYTRLVRTYTARGLQMNGEHITNIAYDAEIFTKPNEQNISYDNRKEDIFDKVIQLKKAILYKIPEKYLENSLGNIIFDKDYSENGVISIDDIKKIQSGENIKLEISEYNKDKDNYIGMHRLGSSQLSEDEDAMSIISVNGKRLVFKVVGEFTIQSGPRKGQKAKITLGMLANPDRYLSKVESIKTSIAKYLLKVDKYSTANGVVLAAEKAKAKWYAENVGTLAEIYRDRIQSYSQLYYEASIGNTKEGVFDANANSLTLDLPGEIEFTGNTEIRTAVRNLDDTVPRLRLSKDSPIKLGGISFEEANPDVSISDVYIYKPILSGYTDLTSSAGKACIFVSRDPTLTDSEALLQRWCEEHAGRWDHSNPVQHSVRMITLDNIGCSLSQLVDSELRKMFKNKSGFNEASINYNSLPYETHRMSVRLIVALWNFRANLYTFRNKLESTLKPGQLFSEFKTFEALNAAITPSLKTMHDFYTKHSDYSETKFRTEYLALYPQDKYAARIWLFNDSLSNTCREFRLGYGNKNPWQIRTLHLQDDCLLYTDKEKKNTVYGIYLTPAYMESLKTSVDSMFSILDLLGFTVRDYKKEGNRTIWKDKSITSIILTEKDSGEISKSATGFVSTIWSSGNSEPVKDGRNSPIQIATKDNSHLDHYILRSFATLVHTAACRAAAYARTEEDALGRYLPNTEDNSHNGLIIRWKPSYFSKTVRFHKDEDGRAVIDKDRPGISVNMLSAIKQGDALLQMLELCFHGTTDEFIEKRLRATLHKVVNGQRLSGNITPLATDAYFKYGFFIDPLATLSNVSGNELVHSFKKSSTDKSMFLVRARIDLPRFSIKPKANKKILELLQKQQKAVMLDTFDQYKQSSINEKIISLNSHIEELELSLKFNENEEIKNIYHLLLWKIDEDNNPFALYTVDGITTRITLINGIDISISKENTVDNTSQKNDETVKNDLDAIKKSYETLINNAVKDAINKINDDFGQDDNININKLTSSLNLYKKAVDALLAITSTSDIGTLFSKYSNKLERLLNFDEIGADIADILQETETLIQKYKDEIDELNNSQCKTGK